MTILFQSPKPSDTLLINYDASISLLIVYRLPNDNHRGVRNVFEKCVKHSVTLSHERRKIVTSTVHGKSECNNLALSPSRSTATFGLN